MHGHMTARAITIDRARPVTGPLRTRSQLLTVLLLGVDIMHQYPCHEMSSVHDIYAKCAQVLAQRASLLESLARRLNGRADSGFGSL